MNPLLQHNNWFAKCVSSKLPPTIQDVFVHPLLLPSTHLSPMTPLKTIEGSDNDIVLEMRDIPDGTDVMIFKSYERERQDGSLNGCPEVPAELEFYSRMPHPNPNYERELFNYRQQRSEFDEIMEAFPAKLKKSLDWIEEQTLKHKTMREKQQAEAQAKLDIEERELYLRLKAKYEV